MLPMRADALIITSFHHFCNLEKVTAPMSDNNVNAPWKSDVKKKIFDLQMPILPKNKKLPLSSTSRIGAVGESCHLF